LSERILRLRRRYILVSVLPSDAKEELWDTALSLFARLYGIAALSSSGLKRVKTGRLGDGLVVSCYHHWLPQAMAALTLITEVGGRYVAADVRAVSGTLDALGRHAHER